MVNSEKIVKTACQGCMCECGVVVHVKNGKAVKIKGNPDYPMSEGFTCAKGLSYLEMQYHPDRLKYPLKRIGKRGEGKWKRVRWDESLDTIAKKLLEIKGKFGPESIAYCYGTYPKNAVGAYLAFLHALGSPTLFLSCGHTCWFPHLVANAATFGEIISSERMPDFRDSKCILLWGFNPLASFPPKAKQILEVVAKGTKLIVVDPRRIPLAEKADLWLQVRPATDAALALGMLNVIINEELYDKEFVEGWCFGFDTLKERVQDYPPEKVAEITWVPADKIIEAARMYATNKPATLQGHLGTSESTHTGQTNRALSILIAITGNFDVKGGNELLRQPPIGTYYEAKEYEKKRPTEWEFEIPRIIHIKFPNEEKQIGAKEFPLACGPSSFLGLNHAPSLYKAMLTGEPHPVKALWCTSNLLVSSEETKLVLEALKKLELFVVVDFFMTPTAEFADFVLPAATWLERDGIADGSTYRNFIGVRQKAVEPVVECLDEHEIIFDLMRRMNLKPALLPVENYVEYLNWRLKKIGIRFDELKERTYVKWEVEYKAYEKGLLRPDGKSGFRTVTGKCELYSTIFEKFGYDPLPYHKEPPESPYSTPDLAKNYPLILIGGTRHMAFYQSMGHNIPSLHRILPDPVIEIHPETARKLGIRDGDWVWIETPHVRDRVKQKAKLTSGIHPKVVSAQALWWYPEEPYQDRRIWEPNINTILPMSPPYDPPYDPIVGSTLLKGCLCKIYKA